MGRKNRILQVVPTIDLMDGGLPMSVISLSHHLVRTGDAEVILLSQSRTRISSTDSQQLLAKDNFSFERIIGRTGKFESKTGLAGRRALTNLVKSRVPSVIHNHGIWTAINHWTSVCGRISGCPTIIQPHGMLEEWALEQSKFKKKSAMWFYQKKDLDSADLFVATSEQEYASIRRFGLHQPIAIIPHGVDIQAQEIQPRLKRRQQKKKTVLFLSRIHPKKGLTDLLLAWARINPLNWSLVIVGNSSDSDYDAKLESNIKELNIESSVQVLGAKYGKDKEVIFKSSDLFILPTYSENFGLVVLEALSFGLPVITTRETPWLDLDQQGCGWAIEPGLESLCRTLGKAINLNNDELDSMGANAQKYSKKFSWDSSAESMMNLYRWVNNQEAKPDFVFLD